MILPFARTNVYTTALAHDQLLALVSRLQPTQGPPQFYQVDNYAARLVRGGFVLRHADPRHNLPAMPKITGELVHAHPTTVRLRIAPNYFILAFLLLFPVVFVPPALFSDNWTINGVHRAPVLTERLEILLIGGGLPLVMGYVCAIAPVKRAEEWLVQKLALH